MIAGATPKLTRSARLSSCAPKRLSAPSMRAARPSSMSKIMAAMISATAVVHSAFMAKRMAVMPDASAIKVMVDGTSLPMDRSSSRSRRAATIWRARRRRVIRSGSMLGPLINPLNKPRQHGFARACGDARRHQDFATRRQINIHAAAETDDAEALPPLHALALWQIADDAPRDQTGDQQKHENTRTIALFCV